MIFINKIIKITQTNTKSFSLFTAYPSQFTTKASKHAHKQLQNPLKNKEQHHQIMNSVICKAPSSRIQSILVKEGTRRPSTRQQRHPDHILSSLLGAEWAKIASNICFSKARAEAVDADICVLFSQHFCVCSQSRFRDFIGCNMSRPLVLFQSPLFEVVEKFSHHPF